MADDAAGPRLRVRVRYFAALREALGAEEHLEAEVGSTVAELHARLRARSERHARVLAPDRPLRMALDQMLLEDPTQVRFVADAELAFFPPVTGG